MKEFFKVTDLETVLAYRTKFPQVKTEEIPLKETVGRILAEDIVADVDLPDFPRAIVDGYALQGASTFGASEGNPAFVAVTGKYVYTRIEATATAKDEEATNFLEGGCADTAFLNENGISIVYNRGSCSNPDLVEVRKNVYLLREQ